MLTVHWQRKFEGLTLQYETHSWRAGDVLCQKSTHFNFQLACVRRPVRARLARSIGSQNRIGTLVLTPAECAVTVDAIGDETEFPVRKFELDTDWLRSLLSPAADFDFGSIDPHPVFDHPIISNTLERISAELLTRESDSDEMLHCLVRMLAMDTARLLNRRVADFSDAAKMLTTDQLARINWSIETADFPELSPDRIARDCEMSLPRLREAYKRSTGQALRDRIEQARRTGACRLLVTTGLPLKIIAHRMGFNHPSAFCYWFKNAVGLTPTEYRMSNVGGLDTSNQSDADGRNGVPSFAMEADFASAHTNH